MIYGMTLKVFQDRRLKPLGHPSEEFNAEDAENAEINLAIYLIDVKRDCDNQQELFHHSWHCSYG
jgi:hypothetical protein